MTNVDPKVFLFAGLVGCGKSTAAEAAEDALARLGTVVTHEISDYGRYLYEQETGNDPEEIDDNALGEWANEVREEKGQDYFARGLAHELSSPIVAAEHINIVGVRCPEAIDAVAETFGRENVTTIAIWTIPDERLKRATERSGVTAYDFVERTERELWTWRCIDLYTGEADYVIPNHYDEYTFKNHVKDCVTAEAKGATRERFSQSLFEDMHEEVAADYL